VEHIYQQPQFGENWFGGVEPLYSKFVDHMKDNSIFVEVGCWKGKSISYMGVEVVNSGKNIKCYAVDTWKGSSEHQSYDEIINDTLYDIFLNNIKCLSHVIIPIRKSSIEAAEDFLDGSIDIVYIDANHDYEEVKKDIQAWLPKVKSGGIISGHDYGGWHGVTKAVDEMFPTGVVSSSVGATWYKEL
jgi:hypothetical protein